MKVLIVGIVVLALAVAGVSTYLIQSFGGEENLEELQKQAEKPNSRVLIATRDLRLGEVLAPEAMAWQNWAEDAVNQQFVVVTKEDQMAPRMKDFEGSVVDALREAIEKEIPDSTAVVSGGGGHFSIDVTAAAFAGKNRVASQRLVYSAIAHLMQGDRAPVHAVDKLTTKTPE